MPPLLLSSPPLLGLLPIEVLLHHVIIAPAVSIPCVTYLTCHAFSESSGSGTQITSACDNDVLYMTELISRPSSVTKDAIGAPLVEGDAVQSRTLLMTCGFHNGYAGGSLCLC